MRFQVAVGKLKTPRKSKTKKNARMKTVLTERRLAERENAQIRGKQWKEKQ